MHGGRQAAGVGDSLDRPDRGMYAADAGGGVGDIWIRSRCSTSCLENCITFYRGTNIIYLIVVLLDISDEQFCSLSCERKCCWFTPRSEP